MDRERLPRIREEEINLPPLVLNRCLREELV